MKNLPYPGFLFREEVPVFQSYSWLLSYSLLFVANNGNFWLLFSASEY